MGKLVTLASALISRARLAGAIGQQFSGDRDIYKALGYTTRLRYADYYGRYQRQDIAGRVVDAPPGATWATPPTLQEDENEETQTPFEKAFSELAERLSLWHYLDRVDRVAGIGRYGVLLIGVADGNLDQPVSKKIKPEDIIFLSPYAEGNAKITSYITDHRNPRFGMPEFYELTLNQEPQIKSTTSRVHYSRVLHVAEGLLEDEVFGQPRLERVYNLLDDLQKVCGGSAEMFWQNAFRGFQADMDKEMELDPDDEKQLSDEIDEYTHGLRRWIRTRGLKINPLGGEVADPRGPFEVLISLISGATGIPQRILLGSERGQLASNTDERNWARRIEERQRKYAEPSILRPLIYRFQEWGVLPEAKFEVKWPDLMTPGDQGRADVAAKIGRAVKDVSQSNGLISQEEFRQHYLGLPRALAGTPIEAPKALPAPTQTDPTEEDDDDANSSANE